MTQTKGPEFKGGINPMYNTLAVQAEAVADPDVYPDFLKPAGPKSIVKPRDPNFKTADEQAFENSEGAWEKYYQKLKEDGHEIPSTNPSLTGDAVTGSTGDAELDALIDSRYPVMANQVVAHEAQLDLTQQASVVQQLPAQR